MNFIYCFTSEDKQDLLKKGYKFFKEETIGNKITYVFLNNDKLNFAFNKDKFILTNKMNY